MTTVVKKQTAAEAREAERQKRTATEQLLLRYARLAPEEIAAKTGIPAEEAMSRLAEILRTRDWMTDRMEERLLLIEMSDLISDVRNRMDSASPELFADIANVALRGYEAVSKRLDARRKLTEDDIAEISRAQGELMMEAIRIAVDMTVEYIGETQPELEIEDDLRTGFARALPMAWATVKGNVRE